MTRLMSILSMMISVASCLKVEVICAPQPTERPDTVLYKRPRPPKPPKDTLIVDTTRIPISFEVSVEDWGDDDNNDINL